MPDPLSHAPSLTASAASGPQAKWRRRKDARPQEILDAALAVFAQKGFAATRVEDIARHAGVSKGTIYLYFKSKDAVFKALVREVASEQLERLANRARQHQGPRRLLIAEIIRGMGRFVAFTDRVALPKLVITEAGNFPDLARFYHQEIAERGLSLLASVIAAGVAAGEFRAVVPAHAARLAIAPMLLIAIWRTTFAQFSSAPYDYEGLVDAHVETFLKGLAP